MMNGLGGFFAMGGYAKFVWPAYGLALAVLTGVAFDAWRRYRASIVALGRLERRRRGRRR